jgi:16S rRNA (uracil1498-N3)-methyltransferase
VQVGDTISATDGNGRVYKIEIDDVSKTSVAGKIADTVTESPSAIQCDLAIPAASAQKTDWVIEKCTELGVSAFHLFACERSTGRRIRENRIERSKRIAVSAIKQSMRAFLPQFYSYEHLKSLAELFSRYDLALYGHLDEGSQELRAALDSHTYKTALVLVGPEAGFTEAETRTLNDAGAVPVSYGEHRLRMETAAVILPAFVIESQQK